MRYVIFFYGGENSAPTFEIALGIARAQVRSHYELTKSIGESFAVIYDKLNGSRWILFKVSSGETRYKQVY